MRPWEHGVIASAPLTPSGLTDGEGWVGRSTWLNVSSCSVPAACCKKLRGRRRRPTRRGSSFAEQPGRIGRSRRRRSLKFADAGEYCVPDPPQDSLKFADAGEYCARSPPGTRSRVLLAMNSGRDVRKHLLLHVLNDESLRGASV